MPAIVAVAQARGRDHAARQHLGDAAALPGDRAWRRPVDPRLHQICRRPFRRDARARSPPRRRIGRKLRDTSYAAGPGRQPRRCWLGAAACARWRCACKQHEASALAIAHWLADQPEVARVLHPGAARSCPGHDLFVRDFKGASGLFAFVLDGGDDAARAAPDRRRSSSSASATAGAASRAWRCRSIPHRYRTATRRDDAGPLVRLQIGLEDSARPHRRPRPGPSPLPECARLAVAFAQHGAAATGPIGILRLVQRSTRWHATGKPDRRRSRKKTRRARHAGGDIAPLKGDTMRFTTILLAGTMLAAASPALAQEATDPPKPITVSRIGRGSSAIIASAASRSPTRTWPCRAASPIAHESGLYVGTWVIEPCRLGHVRRRQHRARPGRRATRFPIGGGALDVGVTWYMYPSGVDNTDFFEPYAKLSGTVGPVSLTRRRRLCAQAAGARPLVQQRHVRRERRLRPGQRQGRQPLSLGRHRRGHSQYGADAQGPCRLFERQPGPRAVRHQRRADGRILSIGWWAPTTRSPAPADAGRCLCRHRHHRPRRRLSAAQLQRSQDGVGSIADGKVVVRRSPPRSDRAVPRRPPPPGASPISVGRCGSPRVLAVALGRGDDVARRRALVDDVGAGIARRSSGCRDRRRVAAGRVERRRFRRAARRPSRRTARRAPGSARSPVLRARRAGRGRDQREIGRDHQRRLARDGEFVGPRAVIAALAAAREQRAATARGRRRR